MKLEQWPDLIQKKMHFHLEFDEEELCYLRFGDITLIKECTDSNKITDKLRALIIIAKRIEEAKHYDEVESSRKER